MLSEQALPHLHVASHLLRSYWPGLGAILVVLMLFSIVAERAHRLHEARAPRPLRTGRRSAGSWFAKLRGSETTAISQVAMPRAMPAMVGREAELSQLKQWFGEVKRGTRRVLFVSGEPGIGKTTLTRTFLESLRGEGSLLVGRGQCIEQYGSGEPYMPILEALTRLCREPGGEKLVEILHRIAPAWLAQMPSLISEEDRVRLQGLAQGVTQQRMLREMAEAVEVMPPIRR